MIYNPNELPKQPYGLGYTGCDGFGDDYTTTMEGRINDTAPGSGDLNCKGFGRNSMMEEGTDFPSSWGPLFRTYSFGHYSCGCGETDCTGEGDVKALTGE